ncbi:hypothetical protein H696_03624 [Fonticula alba]|uniref:HIT domain-containing protein n=1 Tax=Fonticula alba TaxID=691883 RepID=A0A058Z7B6_FONAL|nr:hypothetical protein H696_03624 [Fonticula alba]KCV70165.1 hypothetical protein H696_03624 [Fonticula alba]|eukprot:XP_009495771.1 hypothetical protein H696_03624 [Fonticula alba]
MSLLLCRLSAHTGPLIRLPLSRLLSTSTMSDILPVDHNLNVQYEDFFCPDKVVKFGQVTVRAVNIFYQTPLTLGFLNAYPLLPFHSLVIPRRGVRLLCELTPEEISDLFNSVNIIAEALKVAEPAMNSYSMTVQDGPFSGQSIHHVHAHILPRMTEEIRDDSMYVHLQHNNCEILRQLKAEGGEVAAMLAGMEEDPSLSLEEAAGRTSSLDKYRQTPSMEEKTARAQRLRTFFPEQWPDLASR